MDNSKSIRVLYFVDSLGQGGIQSLLLEIMPEMKKRGFDVELLFLDNGSDSCVMEPQFKIMGVTIHRLKNVRFESPISLVKYKSKLNKFFLDNRYDIVHINAGPKNYFVAKYAKRNGVGRIVYHSHNTNYQTRNPIKRWLGDILKRKVAKFSDLFVACSAEAGEWLFPKSISKKDYVVIHNPIDVNRFVFSEKDRNLMREDLQLNNKFVLIDVARFDFQKNHAFLLDIIAELKKITPDIALLLVGNGELQSKIIEKTHTLGLEDDVIFLGRKTNVEAYLSASDLFIMPSFYEGFPIVSVEAQANGLDCCLSSTITKEAKLNKGTIYIDLKDGEKKWAEIIYETYIQPGIPSKRSIPGWTGNYTFEHFYQQLIDLYM